MSSAPISPSVWATCTRASAKAPRSPSPASSWRAACCAPLARVRMAEGDKRGLDRLTAEDVGRALESMRQRMEAERRQQFSTFGVPPDCLWPASLVYHQHSGLGPAWAPTLTEREAEALTLDLDYKTYPGAPRTALGHPEPLSTTLE